MLVNLVETVGLVQNRAERVANDCGFLKLLKLSKKIKRIKKTKLSGEPRHLLFSTMSNLFVWSQVKARNWRIFNLDPRDTVAPLKSAFQSITTLKETSS